MHLNFPTAELLPAPSCAKPGIVRRFLAWAQSADEEARAQGASTLARAYLYSDLDPSVRAEAAVAMSALTTDPSVLVRRTLGEALCRARRRAADGDPRPGGGRTGSGCRRASIFTGLD